VLVATHKLIFLPFVANMSPRPEVGEYLIGWKSCKSS